MFPPVIAYVYVPLPFVAAFTPFVSVCADVLNVFVIVLSANVNALTVVVAV